MKPRKRGVAQETSLPHQEDPFPHKRGAAREYPAVDKELQEGEPTLG